MLRCQDGTFATPGYAVVTRQREGARGDLFSVTCPTRGLLDRIGGKWTVMLIVLLDRQQGELRFGELLRGATGISRKMLASTLRGLERDGLVRRRVEPTSPPSVHYGLTDLGRSLAGPLAGLRGWAESHMPAVNVNRAAYDDREHPHGNRPR